MFKKINSILLVLVICFTVVGCASNPSDSSQYSSEIIVEETIIETVISDTESTSSEEVASNDSSQQTTSSQTETPVTESSQTTPSQQTQPEEQKNVIPEGGIYICTSKGTVLTAGQEWPETCEEYDTYTYGDYKYIYNKGIMTGISYKGGTPTKEYENIDGWCVRVIEETKSVYGEILESVNGQFIVSLGAVETNDTLYYDLGTFSKCRSLVIAPKIPDTVVVMNWAFYWCTSLVRTPEIPNSVKWINFAFAECYSLVEVLNIPNSVTSMLSAFTNCKSLSGTITINANPTTYVQCFEAVDMSKITLTGDATKETLNKLGATGNNYTSIS